MRVMGIVARCWLRMPWTRKTRMFVMTKRSMYCLWMPSMPTVNMINEAARPSHQKGPMTTIARFMGMQATTSRTQPMDATQ